MSGGVTIGTKHSKTDWGMLMAIREIPLPLPKTNYVEIPGRDGYIDLTEVFGQVYFNDREFTITLHKLDTSRQWDALVTQIANYIHGKKLKITFDADPNYYHCGRCSIDRLLASIMVGTLTINCVTEPYKYKQQPTTVTEAVSTSKEITLVNSRMPAIPSITVDAEMTLAWGTKTTTLAAGTYKVLDLVLAEGNNVITVTGTGNITFTYQEGAL
jgi:predicted phage tail component-like protein